jgi:DcuC family C4-dicarboxylate transporter
MDFNSLVLSGDASAIMAGIVGVLALLLIVRGIDVRLVLFAAALVIAALCGKALNVFDVFLRTMGDGKVIGPICSAMGFAFVLRHTGCDQEMVRLLMKPLRKKTWLLIPGGCLVGFITNSAITSQTASAAAVGPILVPLMLAAGFSPVTTAATLVLGCSAGGALLNPGEPDIVNIYLNSGSKVHEVINAIALPNIAALITAVIIFEILTRKTRRHAQSMQFPDRGQKISLVKALLPPLPVAMVFLFMPSFNLFPWFSAWYPDGLPISHAMIFSTILAMVLFRKELNQLTKNFFEGLGYGYTNVISLIITATCFIEALKIAGLIDALVRGIHGSGFWGYISSLVSTMSLAILSGSGTAPSVAFSKAVLPPLIQAGADISYAIDVGAIGAIGANLGRTMSPVAAVVIFASVLTNTTPQEIVKKVAVPLLCGAVVALVLIAL